MFRVAVLSIVLTLAAGQNAALLCSIWCYPEDAQSAACQHHESTATLTGNDRCNEVLATAIALVREDARRGAFATNAQHADVVLRLRFGPLATHSAFGRDPGQQTPLETRPLVVALRI